LRLRPLALAAAAALFAAAPAAARAAVDAPGAGLATTVDARPFAEAFERFVPFFPATTARYFGYTDLGPQPGDAISAPSEVERYAVLVAPPPMLGAALGQWARSTRATTVAPHPLLRITGGGPVARAWSAPGIGFGATGWQATVAAPSGALRGKLSATVAEEVRGTSASQNGTDAAPTASRVGSLTTASLQLRPVDRLAFQLEEHRISERGGPQDGVRIDGARASATLALVPRVLDLDAAVGTDRVQADSDALATARTSRSLGLTLHLGPALTLSGSTAAQTGDLSPAATSNALFGQLPAARIATGAVAWRASDRLLLSAALSRVETPAGPEVARQLRAAWAPRAGERLGLAVAYEESVDAASGNRAAQAVLQPSLRLNRSTSVGASLTQALRAVAGPVAHPLAVLVSFSIRS
jgi:hypothetical protein